MQRFLILFFAAVGVGFFALTGSAQAQTRTWVSGVGDDANPCSRTAPCKTWAGAISKTADCGEIDALDPGGFGGVTITKGITIDGGGGIVASVLVAGTPGITINNTSANCTFDIIRNIAITGNQSGTTGVNVIAGKNVSLENVDIFGFTGFCVNFQPAQSMNLYADDSHFEGCAGGGIVSGTTTGINRLNIEHSTIERSAVGLTIHSNSDANVHGSMISNNPGGGVLADTNSTALVTIDSSTISNNQAFGVHAMAGGIVRMSNNSVTFNNGTGLLFDTGGQILTWGNNFVGGNAIDGSRSGTITPM